MTDLSDATLLGLLGGERREEAFGLLVNRYARLVYASALRQINDWASAEDVSQAVFIVLWNKSGCLRNGAALPAWLLSVTRLACLDAIKRKMTRTRHEHEASTMPSPNPPVDFNVLAAKLDEAMAALPAADRSAVALRYLVGQSFQEVASSLGVSPDAAKKRVTRALMRLRRNLAERGLNSPADLLETGLTAISLVPAPPSLIPAIHAACHGGVVPAVAMLSKGVQTAMSAAKIKSAAFAIAGVAITLAAGAAVIVGTLGRGGWKEGKPVVLRTATTNASTQPAKKVPGKGTAVYYMGGKVQRPGVYSIGDAPINLLQSVFAAALDDKLNLDTARLTLVRKIDGQKAVYAGYSLHDLMNCKIDPPLLQGGDVIYVTKEPLPGVTDAPLPISPVSGAAAQAISTLVYIGGKVQRPGVYSIKDNPTNAIQLIHAAALANKVNLDNATVALIRRTGPGTSSSTSYSLKDLASGKINLPLQGGDILQISQP